MPRGRKDNHKGESKVPVKSTKKVIKESRLKYRSEKDLNPNHKEDFESLLKKMVTPKTPKKK